jgi:hypothetical protein
MGIKNKKYRIGDLVTRISGARPLLNKAYGVSSTNESFAITPKLPSLGVVIKTSPFLNNKVIVHWLYDIYKTKLPHRVESVKLLKLVNRA